MTMNIQLAKKDELEQCAAILMDTYNKTILDEGWTTKWAVENMQFNFARQPDLFFVAKVDGVVAGFCCAYVKPWSKGNVLVLEENCVNTNFRGQGISKKLLKVLVDAAKTKYDTAVVDAITYECYDKMPWQMYQKWGFEKHLHLFLTSIDIDVLQKSLS